MLMSVVSPMMVWVFLPFLRDKNARSDRCYGVFIMNRRRLMGIYGATEDWEAHYTHRILIQLPSCLPLSAPMQINPRNPIEECSIHLSAKRSRMRYRLSWETTETPQTALGASLHIEYHWRIQKKPSASDCQGDGATKTEPITDVSVKRPIISCEESSFRLLTRWRHTATVEWCKITLSLPKNLRAITLTFVESPNFANNHS